VSWVGSLAPWAGATAAATGAATAAAGGAVPVDVSSFAASGFAASGAVAGAGAAGVVSVGLVSAGLAWLDEGVSVVAVGAGWFFFVFFLLNRPLRAFLTWSSASGATCCRVSVSCRGSRVAATRRG
jgi:hypothetical protein